MPWNAATFTARCGGLYGRLVGFSSKHPAAYAEMLSIAGDAASLLRTIADSIRARGTVVDADTAAAQPQRFTARVTRRDRTNNGQQFTNKTGG